MGARKGLKVGEWLSARQLAKGFFGCCFRFLFKYHQRAPCLKWHLLPPPISVPLHLLYYVMSPDILSYSLMLVLDSPILEWNPRENWDFGDGERLAEGRLIGRLVQMAPALELVLIGGLGAASHLAGRQQEARGLDSVKLHLHNTLQKTEKKASAPIKEWSGEEVEVRVVRKGGLKFSSLRAPGSLTWRVM